MKLIVCYKSSQELYTYNSIIFNIIFILIFSFILYNLLLFHIYNLYCYNLFILSETHSLNLHKNYAHITVLYFISYNSYSYSYSKTCYYSIYTVLIAIFSLFFLFWLNQKNESVEIRFGITPLN